MRLIDYYDVKFFPADLFFIADTLQNGMWGTEYYKFFEGFGMQPSTINACVSALELIRMGILLYQRGIQRKAEGIKTGSLHDEKKLGDD